MDDWTVAGIVLLSLAVGALLATVVPPLFGMLADWISWNAQRHHDLQRRRLLNIGESLDKAAMQMGYHPGDLDEMLGACVRAMHVEGLNPAEMTMTLHSRIERARREQTTPPTEPQPSLPLPDPQG